MRNKIIQLCGFATICLIFFLILTMRPSAHAQTVPAGCVPISATAGMVVGGGTEEIASNQNGTYTGSSACVEVWGSASCAGVNVTCPSGSTKRYSGMGMEVGQWGFSKAYVICTKN